MSVTTNGFGSTKTPEAATEQKILVAKVLRETVSMPGVGPEGVRHPRHAELDEEGFQFGRTSKAITENDNHKTVLENRARECVGELQLGPFDPENNPADNDTLKMQQRLEEERNEIKSQIRVSEGNLLDAKIAAVEAPAPTSGKPREPAIVVLLSAAFLAIPLMPTVFDFWRLSDPVLNWTTAVAISTAIGFAVAKLLFYTPAFKSIETKRTPLIAWFIAVGVAVGFGAIRLALSDSYWLAAGFTLLELFIILAVELVARRYRQASEAWEQFQLGYEKADSLVKLQFARVEELDRRLIAVNSNLQAIKEELYLRHLLATQAEKVERSFVGSILAGYSRAIALNNAEFNTHVKR